MKESGNPYRKPELLAPAGSWDAFKAAVENGADAVYLGLKEFSARQYVANFEAAELKQAIDYAHIRDVRVYLALNTIIADSEMESALLALGNAWNMGIDAVIVQDMGFAAMIRRLLPGMELHASTQASIYNAAGVKTLKELGFSRVVLARELSISEIAEIKTACSDMEVEVFIHGALCVCYSGQCLMSSIIGGRSGNRGKCAQPCRLKYELVGDCLHSHKAFLLSPKDLCALELLPELIRAGVASLKIEGRAKNPEYVATVVRVYRKYLDIAWEQGEIKKIDNEDHHALLQIFNRGGFSQGYLQGKTGPRMMSYEKPKNWGVYLGEVIRYDSRSNWAEIRLEDDLAIGDGIEIWNGEDDSPGTVVSGMQVRANKVDRAFAGQTVSINIRGKIHPGNRVYRTSEKTLLESARESYASSNLRRKIKLEACIELKAGEPVFIRIIDRKGQSVEAVGNLPVETALNRPLDNERVREQVMKTGGTPYMFTDIKINMDNNIAVPLSELNQVRRSAIALYEQKCIASLERNDFNKESLIQILERSQNVQAEQITKLPELTVSFIKLPEDLSWVQPDIRRVYLPLSEYITQKATFLEKAEKLRSNGIDVWLRVPTVTRGNFDKWIENNIKLLLDEGLDKVSIGNSGMLSILGPDFHIHTEASLNVFNRFTFKVLSGMLVESVALSHELTLKQVKEIARYSGNTATECLIYGRIPVMVTEYCAPGCLSNEGAKGEKCPGKCPGKAENVLKDRMGAQFPVVTDRMDCRMTIYNSAPLFMADELDKLVTSGASLLRLDFTIESEKEIRETVELHSQMLHSKSKRLYDKPEELLPFLKNSGFTRGHYYRGV